MEVAGFDAQGAAGTTTFGTRMHVVPEPTETYPTAASATGALAFTGAFGGTIDFGVGPFAARGQGDSDIFVVLVDPPAAS